MTDDTAARIAAANREHFSFYALDPDAEGFMSLARNVAELVRHTMPADADPKQWEMAITTTAGAAQALNIHYPYPEDESRIIGATLVMLGAVAWMLGDGA
jgi:hypothetical protein